MSMARGGIYTADLAAKERGIKTERGRRNELKERGSNQMWGIELFVTAVVCEDSLSLKRWRSIYLSVHVSAENCFGGHS